MASTFRDIVANLADSVMEKATVRLGCKVTSVINRELGGPVYIEADDGFRGSFDNVIVTAPLGCLKRNEHAFWPPLPPTISCAIRSLGYGNLDKVFVKFPRAF